VKAFIPSCNIYFSSNRFITAPNLSHKILDVPVGTPAVLLPGQRIDFHFSKRRNKIGANKFLKQAIKNDGNPEKINIDRNSSTHQESRFTIKGQSYTGRLFSGNDAMCIIYMFLEKFFYLKHSVSHRLDSGDLLH